MRGERFSQSDASADLSASGKTCDSNFTYLKKSPSNEELIEFLS